MSDRKPRSPDSPKALEGDAPRDALGRIVSLSDEELDAELRDAGVRPEDADELVKRTLREAARLAVASQRMPPILPRVSARAARRARRVVVLAAVLFVAAILAGLLLPRRTAGSGHGTTGVPPPAASS